MIIPNDELRLLAKTLADAELLAKTGRFAEGFARLDFGLLWAEIPPVNAATGEVEALPPWAEALVDAYRRALVDYASRYPVTV